MFPVNLNSMEYAQAYAYMLVEHINALPRVGCCSHDFCCFTCSWIRTLYTVGSLESIITLLEVKEYSEHEWWNSKVGRVDISWLEERWSCPLHQYAELDIAA